MHIYTYTHIQIYRAILKSGHPENVRKADYKFANILIILNFFPSKMAEIYVFYRFVPQ